MSVEEVKLTDAQLDQLAARVAAHLRRIPRQPDPEQGLLDAEAVATRLGVPRQRVWALARAGQLASVRIGRELRFNPVDVSTYIARHTTRRTKGQR